MSAQLKRLDQAVAERYPQYSRSQAQQLIAVGAVTVDGVPITKNGYRVEASSKVIIVSQETSRYVSRAGIKLAHALDYFGIDVQNKTILDAGLSTGGFTDCLLQRGAKKIYGVDVGHGQVDQKIATDAKVVVMEHTNLRMLPVLGELVDMVTLDLSFISVLKVIDTVKRVLKPSGHVIVLIKPQFEVGKQIVGRGGIVRDEKERSRAVMRVIEGFKEAGFALIGVTESPITGGDGNFEFLAYFVLN